VSTSRCSASRRTHLPPRGCGSKTLVCGMGLADGGRGGTETWRGRIRDTPRCREALVRAARPATKQSETKEADGAAARAALRRAAVRARPSKAVARSNETASRPANPPRGEEGRDPNRTPRVAGRKRPEHDRPERRRVETVLARLAPVPRRGPAAAPVAVAPGRGPAGARVRRGRPETALSGLFRDARARGLRPLSTWNAQTLSRPNSTGW
jgi:hypothetical protein